MKRSPNTTEFAVTGIELKKVSTASMVNYLNTQECLMISKVLLDGSPPKNLIWKTFWTNLPKIFLHLDQSSQSFGIVCSLRWICKVVLHSWTLQAIVMVKTSPLNHTLVWDAIRYSKKSFWVHWSSRFTRTSQRPCWIRSRWWAASTTSRRKSYWRDYSQVRRFYSSISIRRWFTFGLSVYEYMINSFISPLNNFSIVQ